jgi:hypothetical protein
MMLVKFIRKIESSGSQRSNRIVTEQSALIGGTCGFHSAVERNGSKGYRKEDHTHRWSQKIS